MLFQKKQDYVLPVAQPLTPFLGTTVRFNITREFPIESMFLRVDATTAVGTATANTLNADGRLRLIKKIQVAVADGARTRNVVDCSGAGLVELAKHWTGYLDRNTLGWINTTGAPVALGTTGSFIIPIYFAPPHIEDPLSSAMLLPADRFNNDIQMTIQIAAASEMYGTPGTFSVSAMTMSLIVNRRIIDRTKWPILDTELFEQTQRYVVAGDNQQFEIPITGNYTGCLLRSLVSDANAANALPNGKGDPSLATIAAPGTPNAGDVVDWDIRIAGNVLRRFRMQDLQIENDYSEAHGSAQGDVLAGSYLVDFVADKPGANGGDVTAVLNSLLNANIPLNSGTRIFLRQNIGGSTAGISSTRPVEMNYVFHRVFGNLSEFKL